MVERSIKVTGTQIADGRLLVSAPRRALLPGAKRSFQAICDQLGAPSVDALLPYLGMATDVHFGFEAGDDPIHKAYLEFAQDSPVENIRFLAVKWRGQDVRTNLYFDRTTLPNVERAALMSDVVPQGVVADMLGQIVQRAMAAAPLHDLPLLLVEEEGTARRSLDLNVADLEWRAQDLGDQLAPLFPDGDLPASLHGQQIGHIAAGAARDGQAFATIYYGARGVMASDLPQTARL